MTSSSTTRWIAAVFSALARLALRLSQNAPPPIAAAMTAKNARIPKPEPPPSDELPDDPEVSPLSTGVALVTKALVTAKAPASLLSR